MSRPEPFDPTPAAAPVTRVPRRQHARKRFWLAFILTGLVALPFYPPAWHAALRTWLGWQARRHGGDLSVASIEGGVFDTTQLYGLRWRQRGPRQTDGGPGTDLSIARVDLALAWTVPWFQRPAPSWVREIVLDGVRGEWDLGQLGRAAPASAPALASPVAKDHGLAPAAIRGESLARVLAAVLPTFGGHSARLVPETFLVRADDLRVRRGRYQTHATGLWLSGSRDEAGQFLAREVSIAGPGFENTLLQPHCQTYWKGSRLTLSQLALGPDVTLVTATLDGSHLDRRQIDWEGRLTALGGEVRGQGSVRFARERLALEIAASLQGAAVRPLARLLGIDSPADGLIDRGVFTFHGDLENWAAGQMSLAAHSTDFRWGKRRWETLELQAVVVNRRVQVHRFELRQSRNRVSLTGECPLPPAPVDARTAADTLRQWREGGFSAQIDARLDDLRSLADLIAPHVPELDGRVSINGALSALPGSRQTIDGYLNVEGSRLTLRGAPLDFLRSTLLFKDGGLRVADLQATHDTDYFTGTGSMRLDGPPRYEGELRAEVKRLAAYTPALADLPLTDDLARVNGLNALLRWDDSMLRFEQFQGKFDSAPFTVGGTMDLHDPAHPVMDLSLDGERVTLRHADGQRQMQADCALTVRGRVGNLPTLGGDVRLLGGGEEERLSLTVNPRPDPSTAPDAEATQRVSFPLADWLPARWQDWSLDLNITAAAPLSNHCKLGEYTPDLRITKTGISASPEINGRIDLSGVYFGDFGTGRGTLYFASEFGLVPMVSVVANPVTMFGHAKEVWLYGPATRMESLPVNRSESIGVRLADKTFVAFSAIPETSLPALADNETPWAEWLAAPVPKPSTTEYELILR